MWLCGISSLTSMSIQRETIGAIWGRSWHLMSQTHGMRLLLKLSLLGTKNLHTTLDRRQLPLSMLEPFPSQVQEGSEVGCLPLLVSILLSGTRFLTQPPACYFCWSGCPENPRFTCLCSSSSVVTQAQHHMDFMWILRIRTVPHSYPAWAWLPETLLSFCLYFLPQTYS